MARQLVETYPLISRPTKAQEKLIPSILSPNDVVVRAHTGSGKSFGVLLALMAKPRIVFRSEACPPDARSKGQSDSPTNGISSLIIVPSNELASQYVEWVKHMLPRSMNEVHHSVIQSLVRGADDVTPEEQVARLTRQPPHILVATPRRALEVVSMPGGAAILGIPTLYTLVLDEIDALLDLPGRFPHRKAVWKNLQHPPPGLCLLNEIMKFRVTFSGGPPMNSQGEEGVSPRSRSRQQRTAYHTKQHLLKISPNYTWLAPPRSKDNLQNGEWPLQIVACSASANAVLRSFLGAKTGWLRVNARASKGSPQHFASFGRRGATFEERPLLATWLDLTGLSGSTAARGVPSMEPTALDYLATAQKVMPAELKHSCVVLDEGPPGVMTTPLRNLSTSRVRAASFSGTDQIRSDSSREIDDGVEDADMVTKKRRYSGVVPTWSTGRSEVDVPMLEALAYLFATQGVQRGIAFIPPQWSLRSAQTELTACGVPIVSIEDLRHYEVSTEQADPVLSVLQATSARGLDIPQLDYVFLLGTEAVGDTVRYTHLAGRASRLTLLNADASQTQSRPEGRVVTLVRGLKAEDRLRQPDPVDREEGKQAGPQLQELVDAEQKPPRIQPYKSRQRVASSELKMTNLYRRLGIRLQKLRVKSQQGASRLDRENADTEERSDDVQQGSVAPNHSDG